MSATTGDVSLNFDLGLLTLGLLGPLYQKHLRTEDGIVDGGQIKRVKV